ncbi:NIPSNAP family protein [Streptomyces sp. NPDC054794]
MAKQRITTHGVWTVLAAPGSKTPWLYALVSYRDADDVQARLEAYLSSPEFRADVEGFDISQIVGLDDTLLTPTADSPLR